MGEKKIETNFFVVALVVLIQLQSSRTMTTTITMPNTLNQAFSEIAQESMAVAVTALAAKYKFDVEEATRFLELDSLKFTKKRGPSPKSQADKDLAKAARASAKKDEKKLAKANAKTKGSDEEADKPKAKRGTTGYLLFTAERRPHIKDQLAEALGEGQKVAPQEVIKVLAKSWKALPEEEQEVWRASARMANMESE